MDEAQTYGFDSLLFLTQALAKRPQMSGVTIGVLSNNMQRIAGEAYDPEKALVLGLCKVIPLEQPAISCRSIDIALESDGTAPDELVELVLAELGTSSRDAVLAYRGAQRWVQVFEPVRLNPRDGANRRLREGGVYLITGGLGGIGLTLAEHLARTARARLVLTSRTGLPERDTWPRVLATGSSELSRAIRAVQALEAHGSEVLIFAADVTDPAQMRQVVERSVERFGALHGVIHAAGVAGGGMIQMKTPEEAARVLAPKVQGTLALHEAVRDVPLDFLALCSSITSITGGFGQADYCSANAFLDAFAASHNRPKGPFIVSINWDRWKEVGMAVRTAAPADFRALQQGAARLPIRHPLLDACLVSAPEQAIYWSEFSVARNWVLSEHLIAGVATVPGTTYLEMARAAFAHMTQHSTAELRDVVFVAPLAVQEHERKDVLTILEREESGYTFRVISRPRPEGDTSARWQEHARGRIRPLAAEAEPYAIDELIARCAPIDVATNGASETNGHSAFLITGPRWHTVAQVYLGDHEGVTLLELPEAYADDLRDYALHPAMLDTAAGAVKFMGEGDYLPLTYGSLRVLAAFPRQIYSAIAYKGARQTTKDILTCDVTIVDEDGAVLAAIEGFSMRRVTSGMLALSNEQAPASMALLDEAIGRAYDELVAQALAEQEYGITPAEGAQVFDTILSSAYLPQIVVATSDLHQEITRVNQLTTSQILDQLAQARVAAPTRGAARPKDLAAASASEIERQVIEIWQRVLGIEQIGVNDNFFELGGTSLSGIQVIAELKATWNVEIPAVSIFEAPTISALVKYLRPEQQERSFDHSHNRAKKREQGLELFKGKKR